MFTEAAAEFTELDTLNISVYLLCFAHVLVILTKKKKICLCFVRVKILEPCTLLENSRSGLIWSKIQSVETVKHDCYDGVWRARVIYVYSMFCNSVSGSTQWHQLVFSVSRQRSVRWGGEAAADALPVWGVRACPVSTGKSLHAHILSQRWGKTSATRLTHTNAAHQSTTSQGHRFVLQLSAALFVPLCHRCTG